MTRLLAFGAGLVVLALLGLSALWLLGEVLSGVGGVLVGAAALLTGVLRFLLVSGALGLVLYILTSSWARPGR